MKTLIQIDINSIKKNKNAGETVSYFQGEKYCKISGNEIPSFLKHEENCWIESINTIDEKVVNFCGLLYDTSEEIITKCLKAHLKIEFENQINEIHHFPIPKYNFKYENTKLKCKECGCEIMSEDFETDWIYDGEDEYFTGVICPNCNSYHCVDIEYESIKDALKRRGK